jgi:hypothetical protein
LAATNLQNVELSPRTEKAVCIFVTMTMLLADVSIIDRRPQMARKPATRAEFVLFDVFYEDGSRRSNRRVPSEILGGFDGDAAARAAIEEQDRIIAERSHAPALAIKSIRRSGGK